MDLAGEQALRALIMEYLERQVSDNGGSITRAELSAFSVGELGLRRLIDQSRGIWNPSDLRATLSVLSSPDGPYADRELEGGWFRYDYRAGTTGGDNTKLRKAYELELPVILLRKIGDSRYAPIFPVYVVGDDVARRQFILALDESLRFLPDPLNPSAAERRYAERIVRHRLHQAEFRGRVIHAYATQCAVCNLRHGELLDAAHITSDADEQGLPVVTNGLSLCKIHHSAYDRNLLGITADYEVRINSELLHEIDGPMLRHGIQEMHRRPLTVPTRKLDRPDRERLAMRFEVFAASS